MNVCITGHRPDKLYGYDMSDARYACLKSFISDKLLELKCSKLYCGMALGVDQLAAKACIDLRDFYGYDMELIACIPFKGQESMWPYTSRVEYRNLLEKCDDKIIICEGGYAPWKMHERNRYMVDHSDAVIAVWDGSPGGTENCVKYATSRGKRVVNLYNKH